MKTIGEFKKFIMRGNIMDMAVGVVVGSAFTAIVTSLVNDIIMPVIGIILGDTDFSGLKLVIGGTAEEPVTLNYGAFIQTIVNFLIIALCIFFVIKFVNKLMDTVIHKKEEEEAAAPPPEPSDEAKLLAEIRDMLKDQQG